MLVIHISNESFTSIPAFPLEGIHLFPHMVLPLTIFEPRYVEMVDYALEHDHLISIASPMTNEEDPDHSEPPALNPILGAGVIIAKEEVSSKRYNIFVRGVTRILLREELEQIHSFRQVEAEILQDEEVDEERLLIKENELRNTIKSNHVVNAEILEHPL